MWGKENKTWMHYVNDIIAADVPSAVFLSSYMRNAIRSKSFMHHLEVIDLQRYKIIRKVNKVRAAIGTRTHLPFIFVIGKN